MVERQENRNMASSTTATVNPQAFKKPKDPSAAIVEFDRYVERAGLMFDVLGITVNDENKAKCKGLLQIWGGSDMEDLFTDQVR